MLNRIEAHHESHIRFERACKTASIIAAEVAGIQRIVLFGSTVRAQARSTSDIDLAVIVSGDRRQDPGLIAKWIEIKQKIDRNGINREMDITCWWENEHMTAQELARTSCLGKKTHWSKQYAKD